MSNTPNLGLPQLLAAQAQKHVTVNEALALLDGLSQLVLADVALATPPTSPAEGICFGVPAGALSAWAGQDGRIAIWSNGGWIFADPMPGWRAFVVSANAQAIFDGSEWMIGAVAATQNGATTVHEIIETDHLIQAGATSAVPGALPANAMVIGVTGRVTTAITGALTSFRIGVSGFDDRYGSGIGLVQSTWLRGLTSAPVSYYSDTDIVLTGEGGDFVSGELRLAVHLMKLGLPN